MSAPYGPAFPQPRDIEGHCPEDYGRGGMTLRDYFAAHAPAEPQSWHRPLPSTPRPTHVRDEQGAVVTDTSGYPVLTGDLGAWEAERDKLRRATWPYAWADAVLAARDGVQTVRPPEDD